jgi:hypothetical protein
MEKNKIIINAVMILAIYFLFAKPILKFFRKPGKESYQAEANDPQSPLNGNFWQRYFYIVGMTANGRRLLSLGTYTKCRDAAKKIFDSFGYINDDETQFFGALNSLSSKSEVSLAASILEQKYNTSLLSLMNYGKGTLPQNGLSDGEINTAINFVNNLPNL